MTRRPIEAGLGRSGQTLLAGLLACVLAVPASAAGELDALSGRWRGGGMDLLIDAERMQANSDPERPFARVPLVMRNVTGPMFLFSIGRETFLGRVEGATLNLTRLGSPGTTILTRVP